MCSRGPWTLPKYGLGFGTLHVLISLTLSVLLGATCDDEMRLKRWEKRRKAQVGLEERGKGVRVWKRAFLSTPAPYHTPFPSHITLLFPPKSQPVSSPFFPLTDQCLCALKANELYRPKYGVSDTLVLTRPRSRCFAWCGLWGWVGLGFFVEEEREQEEDGEWLDMEREVAMENDRILLMMSSQLTD